MLRPHPESPGYRHGAHDANPRQPKGPSHLITSARNRARPRQPTQGGIGAPRLGRRRRLALLVAANSLANRARGSLAAGLDGLQLRRLGPRQRIEAAEAELLQELRRGAEERGPPDGRGAANLLRQPVLDQAGERAVAVDAADELDLRARDRLAIGDDGQRLERG